MTIFKQHISSVDVTIYFVHSGVYYYFEYYSNTVENVQIHQIRINIIIYYIIINTTNKSITIRILRKGL